MAPRTTAELNIPLRISLMSIAIAATLFFIESAHVHGYGSSSLGLLLPFAFFALSAWAPILAPKLEAGLQAAIASLSPSSALRLGCLAALAASLCLILAGVINPVSRGVIAFKFAGVLFILVAFLFASRYFEAQPGQQKARLAYWLRLAGICVIPLAVNCILAQLFFHKGLFDIVLYDKEDMFYWHQSKTFSQVFFAGGYYTAYEKPAALAFTHFGNHGFVFPMIYGTLGRLLGWQPYSILLINHLLFSAALMAYFRIARPAGEDLPLIAIFIATFSPIALYLTSSRSDGFQLTAGVLAAAMFLWLQKRRSWAATVASLALVCVLTVSRPTWGILFIPFVFMATAGWPLAWRILGSVAIGLGLAYLSYQFWALSAAPYTIDLPFAQGSQAMAAANGGDKLDLLRLNLVDFFAYRPFSSGGFVVWGTFALIAILLLLSFKPLFKKSWKLAAWLETYETALMLAFILGGVFLFLFPFLGFAVRAERYLSSFLILACLILLRAKRFRPLLMLVLLWQVASLPAALGAFGAYFHPYYESPYPDKDFVRMQRVISEHIHFVPGANPWCNTILTEETPPTLMAVPGGVGMSTKFEDIETALYTLPFKSRYILLDKYIEGQNWQLLSLTPYGGLYLNLDSECELPPER